MQSLSGLRGRENKESIAKPACHFGYAKEPQYWQAIGHRDRPDLPITFKRRVNSGAAVTSFGAWWEHGAVVSIRVEQSGVEWSVGACAHTCSAQAVGVTVANLAIFENSEFTRQPFNRSNEPTHHHRANNTFHPLHYSFSFTNTSRWQQSA